MILIEDNSSCFNLKTEIMSLLSVDFTSKILSNDTDPCWVVVLLECFFDLCGYFQIRNIRVINSFNCVYR